MIENVYQHFRKEERPFIDALSEWITEVEDQYTPYLTDFLDPRQMYIVESLVGKRDLKLYYFGGYEAAERKRIFICPDYYTPTQEEFKIDICEIRYPTKFAKLSHSKILGTLMSVGVKREYFGDIVFDGERWQFFVDVGMKNYVENQVDKIGNVSVRIETRDYTEIITPIDDWTLVQDTVSSMRLDAIIASIFKISRQRAKQLIEAGKVKLNWAEQLRPDFELGLLDIVSVRGYGRIQIKEIEGKTKKDKWRIQFGVLFK
ncbi:RNA-binding protein [Carnobacterium maltaromaticum]|uniref:YlmH family RNA-binding protein n=1 Tax=Carnobacterium maltaromaticum TaxID=2751 RepID=UPI001D940C41|nr:RNA-binding protein [Carnobacterium maltaromaticum]MCC4311742.1 RNA-binding protein [Carnobacterium maltaromaticum]